MSDRNENSLEVVSVDLRKNDLAPPERLREGWTGCLLHGFGASANDLIGLAPELALAGEWYFPHAPEEITVAGMSYGRAWFPRESDALQQAVFGTYFQNLRSLTPPGLAESARLVRQTLNRRGVAWDRLILGGFSQGAMVAAEVLRQGLEERSRPVPAMVLLFSGALIAEEWWGGVSSVDGGSAAAAVRVFQSHGRDDSILPFSEGLALAEQLDRAGFSVRFSEFDGGHTIPKGIVRAAAALMAEET
jgi:phospholipase/carboxylesterase